MEKLSTLRTLPVNAQLQQRNGSENKHGKSMCEPRLKRNLFLLGFVVYIYKWRRKSCRKSGRKSVGREGFLSFRQMITRLSMKSFEMLY